jgi:hypothetical protein
MNVQIDPDEHNGQSKHRMQVATSRTKVELQSYKRVMAPNAQLRENCSSSPEISDSTARKCWTTYHDISNEPWGQS